MCILYSYDSAILYTHTPADLSADHLYVPSDIPLKGSPQLQWKGSATWQSYDRSYSLDFTGSDQVPDLTKSEDHTDDGRIKEKDKGVMMIGWLRITSQAKNPKTRGRSRQHRYFRLTAHSLEYSHQPQMVVIC